MLLRSGLHGYSHENPVAMTAEQQQDILDHTYELLTKFNNGVPPKGSVAPWWETSEEGTQILLDKGIEYGAFRASTYTVLSLKITLQITRTWHTSEPLHKQSTGVGLAADLPPYVAPRHTTCATKICGPRLITLTRRRRTPG